MSDSSRVLGTTVRNSPTNLCFGRRRGYYSGNKWQIFPRLRYFLNRRSGPASCSIPPLPTSIPPCDAGNGLAVAGVYGGGIFHFQRFTLAALCFARFLSPALVAIGTVKWFNPMKGYGFINPTKAAGMFSCTSQRSKKRDAAASTRVPR